MKLFTPDANATWLLTELDPSEPDIAFGLCDLGLGYLELGYVRLSELQPVRGRLGLLVEHERWFTGKAPLSAYADAAHRRGAGTGGGLMPPSTRRWRVAVSNWDARSIVVEAPDQAAAEQLAEQLWADDPDQFTYRKNGTDGFVADPLD